MDHSLENEQTAQHLWNISMQLSSTCPAASRYYMFNFTRKSLSEPNSLKTGAKRSQHCNYCGSVWAPGNHRVQVNPPPSPCGHTKALLRSQQKISIMNNRQKKRLKKFLAKQTSKIVYTCFICKKKTEFPGIVKPGRKEMGQPSFHTPLPKIKCKKRNVTAGLYVKTPSEESKHERIPNSDSSEFLSLLDTSVKVADDNSSVLSDKSTSNSSTPSLARWLPAKHSTPANLNHMPHNSPAFTQAHKNSSAKKRKSLSAKLVSDEQNNKKKKNSLSSFLISL